jgi:predicted RNA-binding Zn-ribbon protein involved in translation (DUF1610 family)
MPEDRRQRRKPQFHCSHCGRQVESRRDLVHRICPSCRDAKIVLARESGAYGWHSNRFSYESELEAALAIKDLFHWIGRTLLTSQNAF